MGHYKDARCFIANYHVNKFLQKVAATVFKLKPKDKAITRWTTHSIWITSCNLLHRQGFSDTYIQMRPRWKSTAFLNYLCNTLNTTSAHTKALRIAMNNLPVLMTRFAKMPMPRGT